MRIAVLLSCLVVLAGCGEREIESAVGTTDAGVGDGGQSPDGGVAPDAGGKVPGTVYWKQPDALTLAEPFYAAHPGVFSRMSRYVTHVEGDPRPDVGHRGSFGTGNGHVFGFVGLDYPLNTLHSLVGPTYEKKDERFFGDYRIYLNETGATDMTRFDEEWALRSLSAPVVVTRGVRGAVELDTIDFGPVTGDADLRGCFVRLLVARNRDAAPSPALEIAVVPHNTVTSPEAGVIVEVAGQRGLTTRFARAGAEVVKNHLVLALGALAAGEEKTVPLVHCAREDLQAAAAPSFDPGAMLDATADAYQRWEENLVRFDVPDPMVADFLDGMKMTLKVQTAATGASCPMSEYTRTWTRDNIGPILAWLDLGAFADAGAMMDYIYGATVMAGDLQNSYPADLDLSTLPAPPDWISMPTMTGKTAAEGPSYNVMTYGLWHRFTGDTSKFDARFGLIRRCLFAQGFGDDRLLPYSGDETFRAAMNAAFGLGLDYPHHDKSFSSNSSLLWLGASNAYRRLATATGRGDEAELARLTAVEVEAGMRKHFMLADGCISALVDRATGEAWPAPFEDEALQVTWSGWKDGDDPFAVSTLDCLIKRIRREPGVLLSRLDPKYKDWFPNVKKGILTGMLPGFTLAVLAGAGHPEAQDAFNEAGLVIDTSGNLSEYGIYDDHSGLTLIYDGAGGQGDYTAKFRPWEGGIVFDALFKYLTGFAPDAAAKTIALRPHLPNWWPSASYVGLRIADDRFDLAVTRKSLHEVEVQVTSRAATDYTIDLRWDDAAGAAPAFAVDGAAVKETEVKRFSHFGAVSAKITTALPAGKTVVVGIIE